MTTVRNDGHVVKVEGEIIFAFTPFVLKDVCKSIPGAKWNAEVKAWTYPANPLTAQTINTRFPPRIKRSPEFLQLARYADVQRARDNDTKTATDLPPIPRTNLDAWNHQRQAFWFAKDKTGAMLAMDMGTGKSKVAIDLLQNNHAKRVLIIAPKSVVAVWPREFKKHCAVEYRIFAMNRGTIGKRVSEAKYMLNEAQILDSEAMYVFVVNYEAAWRDEMSDWIKSVKWDYMICDESHKIKAPNGVASKAIAKMGKNAKRRLCLTGTPLPHSPMDAFAQYRFLDSSVFGNSYQVFKNTYGIWGGYGGHELIGYRNQDDFNSRFYSVAYRVGKEVLDLPEILHIERTFELDSRAASFYSDLQEEFITFVQDGREVTVANALVKLLKLQQITSGFLPTDDGSVLDLDSGKADMLEEVIDEISADEPIVVFARFRRDLDNIKKVAQAAGREYIELSGRENNLAEWQAATGGQVLGVQMQSGGVGVDLTRARYCIYYSVGFSLGDYVQSLARIHRPGQKRPVTYVHLIAEGTVDRKVYDALSNRREVVEAILEEIRA